MQKKLFTLYTAINTYTITCLENQKAYTYGITFPSWVRYVRVSDFTTGKCQTIVTAATKSTTILWYDVYADVIDLSASELTISSMKIGRTGITVNGKNQYQDVDITSLGEITIG